MHTKRHFNETSVGCTSSNMLDVCVSNCFLESISEQRKRYSDINGYLWKPTNWAKATFTPLPIGGRSRETAPGFLRRLHPPSSSSSSQNWDSYSSSAGFFSSDPVPGHITIHGEEPDRSRKNGGIYRMCTRYSIFRSIAIYLFIVNR